jgi:putative Mn2+ efflux pump MntP
LRRGPRFLGVEVPLLLQFSIALFTGMVAATLVPPVRKSIPRPVEILAWTALVVACVIGIISITSPNARELTTSAVWGIDQVISTLVGLLGAGLLGWLADNRFTVATVVTFVLGADILALALVRSYRKSRGWRPQVRLMEWMELPRLAPASPQPVAVPYALDELNRKWGAAAAIAGATLLTWSVNFAIWSRDVLLPRQAARLAHAATAGREGSRAGLESLRDTASQLQFAARAWYTAAGAPAVSDLATKATTAVRSVRARRGAEAPGLASHAPEVRVLLSTQSIGWYGPVRPAPVVRGGEDEDASQQSDRLAS